MKISFRNTFRDLVNFNLYVMFHSPVVFIFTGICVAFLTKPNWDAAMKAGDDHSLAFRVILFTILELIPVAFMGIVTVIAMILGNISKMNKTVLTDVTHTFGEDAIHSESQYSKSEIMWTAVQKITRTKSYIYLFVMQSSAIVIPKRAFATQEAWEDLWKFCSEKKQK